MPAHRDVGFSAKHGLFEFQRDIFAQVGTSLGPCTAAGASTEKISKAEKVSEYLADVLKNRWIEASRSSSAHRSVAKAVVCRPLVGIRQDRVRFAALFEFLLGVGIVRIAVRMELQSQLAVGALDLLFTGFTGNSEDFVVVAFYVAGQNGSTFLSFS